MRLIFALVAFFVTATATVAQQYRLQPGDVIRVEVLEDPDLSRQVFVLPDGNITFPLAGNVRAGGRTLQQVQNSLSGALAPNFAAPPTVFVSVVRLSPEEDEAEELITVYVLGEVSNPGQRQVKKGTQILQFLAQAEPFSRFAATKRLQLRRVDAHGVEKQYNINYRAIQRGAMVYSNFLVKEGDVLVVPQRRLFE